MVTTIKEPAPIKLIPKLLVTTLKGFIKKQDEDERNLMAKVVEDGANCYKEVDAGEFVTLEWKVENKGRHFWSKSTEIEAYMPESVLI